MARHVVVIGGGLVGLATAFKLRRAHPEVAVTVVEKERAVAQHQSSHNSGVLHAGLYYAPGSFKARLAVSGIRQMVAFCQEHGVPHEICGKLVIATDDSELPGLRTLLERGKRNGLAGLQWLESAAIREREPHAAGIAAVHVPEEGIADYPRVALALVKCIEALGGIVRTSTGVRALRAEGAGWIVETSAGDVACDVIVNCAGLHTDRIARLAGERPDVRIMPFRGEYYALREARRHLVRHLIYPVPDPGFPFLGVHFTRRIGGGIEAGPNAVLATAREGYSIWRVSPRDALEAMTFPGLWRFLAKHPRTSWAEVRRSMSRSLFAQALARLVPELTEADLVPGGAGVRAQAMLPSGELVQDFIFLESANALHVLNAPSPAATASLAIGDEIVRRLESRLH